MNPQDPMLAKVRKLLAQAEDPAATPAEAEAFTARATRLIADYGIDRALLDEATPGCDPVGDLVIDIDPPYANEKATLASVVADGLRCRAVVRKGRSAGGSAYSVHLFGRGSDLVCVEILLTSLLLQGTHGLLASPVPPWEHKAAFRRTWWLGFAGAVGHRLRASEEEAAHAAEARFAAAGTSAALVLADHAREAEQAMRTAYPRLRTAPGRRLSGGGHAYGWATGQRADLGTDGRLGGALRGEIA
ncbi:MAG TPA: DUF2786 domain-containing protein [Marmoricola sp.]|nr:DUF2786 domain-containing protein [Marmoricola sp.]